MCVKGFHTGEDERLVSFAVVLFFTNVSISRLVIATLEIGGDHLHMLSCYAPTFNASSEVKDSF